MGQFMGYASYDLKTRCGICGEVGPPEGEEPDEDGDEDEEKE